MTRSQFPLGRRAFLAGLGGTAGVALTRGLGAWQPAPASLSYEEALRAFGASLTPGQRDRIVLPVDHPSREVTNTLTFLERPHLGTLLSASQQRQVAYLVDTMLSDRGRRAFAGTLAVEGKLEGSTLAIYGDPASGRAQTTVIGGHVHVRSAGPDDTPLGGAVAYGHQIGNHRWRVAGNSFAYHGDAANALFEALPEASRARAIVSDTPHELVVQPQGPDGEFDGAPLRGAGDRAQGAAEQLLETVLGLYPDAARVRARAAIDANGGVAALHVAFSAKRGFYEDMQPWSALDPPERARRGAPYWQVWRVEGPGLVIHFQGHPHVHAYVHVVDDPARRHVGETLAETRRRIDGEGMRDLLEGALRRATGAAHAWYPLQVAGRFCPGPITTGLAWSLDPYANEVVLARVPHVPADSPVGVRLAAKNGSAIDPSRPVRIATTDYAIREAFPDAEVEPTGAKLRDALVEHLRAGALA